MKKTVTFILSLLLAWAAYSYDGALSGETKLNVLKTQWFDVIYPPSSQQSAFILYDKADALYEELTATYGITPQFRMPVVITPAVEEFNAYWTNYPYNHIVVYDTGTIDDLMVFSETLLSTFKHELTHAITYNMRSDLLKKFDDIFGDPMNPGLLFTITSGWAEGATVSSESMKGEGRLNDEYAMQMVKQAKIEGKFPHYADVQGASDLYPMGSFYYFNGAFADWLQKKYGLDKYAAFWYKCVNLETLTAEGAFKKAFGVKLYEAWKAFEEDFEVPKLVEVHQNNVVNNNSGAVYGALTVSDKGIAFINEKSGLVYFIPSDKVGRREVTPEKLFYQPYLSRISFSKDGNYLAMDIMLDEEMAEKKTVSIYSTNKKKFYSLKETGIKESSIIQKGSDYYLVCQKFISQYNSICIYKLNSLFENPSASPEKISEINFKHEIVPYSFTDIGNGSFAFIKKSGLNYSICTADIEGNLLEEYAAPKDRMSIRYMSFDGESLLFSWTEPGTLPRLGKLCGNRFVLQSEDFSGGVYWPVNVDDEVVYVGSFYRQNKIFSGEIECNDVFTAVKTEGCEGIVESTALVNTTLFAEGKSLKDYPEENYNPFNYYKRGLFYPVATVNSETHKQFVDSSIGLPIGVTYISGNPWDTGLLQISAGYGFYVNSFGVGASYSGGSHDSLFNYSVSANTVFDRYFWKQASTSFDVYSALPLGRTSYLLFENSGTLFYGRGDKQSDGKTKLKPGFLASDDKTNYFYGQDRFNLSYTNVHKVASSRNEKAGIQVTGDLTFTYKTDGFSKNAEVYEKIGNVGLYSIIYVPRLIPITNTFRFTNNLPVKIGLSLFTDCSRAYPLTNELGEVVEFDPSSYILPPYTLAKASFEVLLFAYEIQKSVPGIRYAFANDLKVSFLYNCGFDYPADMYGKSWQFMYAGDYLNRLTAGELDFSGYYTLRASLALAPNFGSLASYSNKTYFYAQASWMKLEFKGIDFGFDVAF